MASSIKINGQELKEVLDWISGKSASEIAHEIVKLRRTNILSGRDFLTNLRDRKGLMFDLSYKRALAKRDKKKILVLLFDVDNLKKINDGNGGHSEGDRVLVDTARALESTLRETDIIARWGGDEFVALCLVEKLEDGELILKKIRQKLTANSASIGYTIWETSEDFAQALDRADARMYKEKKEKKESRG